MARLIDKEKDKLFIKLYKRGVTYREMRAAMKNKSVGSLTARRRRLVRERKLSTARALQ